MKGERGSSTIRGYNNNFYKAACNQDCVLHMFRRWPPLLVPRTTPVVDEIGVVVARGRGVRPREGIASTARRGENCNEQWGVRGRWKETTLCGTERRRNHLVVGERDGRREGLV